MFRARQAFQVCCAIVLSAALLQSAAANAQSKGDPQRGATKAATCNACHAAPSPLMPILAAQPEPFLVLQLVLMREGLREVPAMAGLLKGLTDTDLVDIAAYYSRQPPPRNRASAASARFARGGELAQGMGCATCHRADYAGQQQIPRLAGQREDYLAAAMKAYRDDRRTGTDTSMNGILYQVSDPDIDALAHYLTRQ